jgi:hypothetical protein
MTAESGKQKKGSRIPQRRGALDNWTVATQASPYEKTFLDGLMREKRIRLQLAVDSVTPSMYNGGNRRMVVLSCGCKRLSYPPHPNIDDITICARHPNREPRVRSWKAAPCKIPVHLRYRDKTNESKRLRTLKEKDGNEI